MISMESTIHRWGRHTDNELKGRLMTDNDKHLGKDHEEQEQDLTTWGQNTRKH